MFAHNCAMTRTNTLSTRYRRVSMAEVRSRLGAPEEMIEGKKLDHVDKHARRFIAHSPFLALPDRPGNKIADSFRNIAENDGVGLLFFIPGVREVLRVNGSAYVTDDPDVLARMRTDAKAPIFAIIVEVAETYFHCGRALLRSRLWDPASQALAAELPSAGEIVADQLGLAVAPAMFEQLREDSYRKLY